MFGLKYRFFRDVITILKYLKAFHAEVERRQVMDMWREGSGRKIVSTRSKKCCECELVMGAVILSRSGLQFGCVKSTHHTSAYCREAPVLDRRWHLLTTRVLPPLNSMSL